MRIPSLRSLCLATMVLLAAPSAFGGAGEAERYRLQTELESLARKNAWSGVDRIYKELVALNLELTLSDYMLGSQAAFSQGDLLEGLTRLQIGLAKATPSDDPASDYQQAKAIASGIEERFGQVRIRVGNCLPVLFRSPPPFAQDERDAFLRAQALIRDNKSFTGLLPVGEYKIDTTLIVVEPGQVKDPIAICM